MKLEEQVLSIEQARHLQELGLDMSDAALCWSDAFSASGNCCNILFYAKGEMKEFQNIPTYTLQEILDKLPRGNIRYIEDNLYSWFERNEREIHFCVKKELFDNSVNILESAYKMLCWVLENGYLKEEKK